VLGSWPILVAQSGPGGPAARVTPEQHIAGTRLLDSICRYGKIIMSW
jgi:hypothetical protein